MGTKDSITTKTFKRPVFTEHLKALGKLDFPKAFFVLSSITPYALEEVLSVHRINDLQDLPMAAVESNLRQALAIKSESAFHFERKKYDWDPNKMYEYHCHVDREGNCVFKDENKREVYDLNGERLIHTDGTGFISEDLASQCPKNVFKGKHLSNQISEACPLLIQGRLFYNGYAVKGTFLVNRTLPCKSIQFRESMIKVERDKKYDGCQSINSLEICGTSYKPNTASLSRYLIALLNYGGVPKDFFVEHVITALDKIQNELKDETKAWKVIRQCKDVDEDHVCLRMLSCGIPLYEPFLQHRLKQFMCMEIKKFKEGRVPLEDSYYLMGTADPTGKLEPNEVCIILDHGQISGKVLVYKNPGLHFGDIHVCKATYVEEIGKVVGDSKFGIFFSTQGPRSTTDEIANGDFDGDRYWVCMNAKVLEHFKPESPWMRPIQDRGALQPKPTDFSAEKLEEELFEEFLNIRFAPSNVISVAAESWLVFMDRLLTPQVTNVKECEILKEKMQKLTNIYYEALDAPKTGKKVEVPKDLKPEKRPHFLKKNPEDKRPNQFYESASVLGKIYDLTSSYDGVQSDEIWTIPCFQDANVGELRTLWYQHYADYRWDMKIALEGTDSSSSDFHAKSVIQKYKEILYGAASLDESKKQRQRIHDEACAIYQVVYEYAKLKNDTCKCYFAWRVAGEALCEIYFHNHQKKPILISPALLYDILS